MPNTAPPALAQRIVIHHLSDLHYQQQSRAHNDDPLIRYRQYLDELEPARKPSLVVITGDLTASGARNDLSTVAALLRSFFPAWAGSLAQHIFIVPGPRDLNWDATDLPGLQAFYTAFQEFGLPSTAHTVPQHKVTVRQPLSCIAYPIDTCYSLAECRLEMQEQFQRYGSAYNAFVNQYKQARDQLARSRSSGLLNFIRRDQKPDFTALYARYLLLTEDNDLTMLDAGRVHPDDLKTFTAWVPTLRQAPSGGTVGYDPLKVLITHHPLTVEAEQPAAATAPTGGPQADQHPAPLADLAGQAGFHLALHGHIHKPQLLSDLSLLQEPGIRHPMRQVGAGSLGDGGTFNEITAVYSQDGDQNQQNHWRLEIRTINVRVQSPHDTPAWMLLNPTEDLAKRADELAAEANRRQEFDRSVRSAMLQFSELVYRTQPEDSLSRSAPVLLPQPAMQAVEGMIDRFVYPDLDVRVRLYLKDKQASKAVPKLNAVYLAPPGSNSGPVTYPASVAALSLLLGRTLVYPRDGAMRLDDQDRMWLRRNGKDRELTTILEALIREPPQSGFPVQDEVKRYQSLLTKFTAMWRGDPDAQPVTGADFYREGEPGVVQAYPAFVCVPYPLRAADVRGPDMPEIAVLVVSMRAPEESGDAQAGPGTSVDVIERRAALPERISMLESLTELIGMILVSSSAVGKPKGVWDDRLRV